MSGKTLTISRGAQFKGGNTAYLFFVMVALVVYAIVLAVENEMLLAATCFVVAALLTVFVLDIRGVEIDLAKQRYREYVIRPWGKTGKWLPLKKLKAVELYFEDYVVKVRAMYSRLANPAAPRYNHERHWRYALYFTCFSGSEPTLLMESQQLDSCLRFGRTAANRLRVPFRNHVKR